jgi:hypothetical protein
VLVFGHQDFLCLPNAVGSNSKPVQDSVLFVTFDSCQTADSNALGDERRCLDDSILWHSVTIEEGSLGSGKGLLASLALVSLATSFGLSGFLNVPLLIGLNSAIVRTEITR